MTIYTVVFAPEAEEQLAQLYRYIADHASPAIALRYTSAIIEYCEGMKAVPHRGVRRDDIRPGLRITHYKGRAAIAFAVEGEQVSIIGVYYGGQDYEAALQLEPDE
ncbi:MAG TPA: type II toxin-antitoxin system RelE/ParE family toxin [Steroidobacteraceae bacterium]|nr:type II toxin-antitoxin system RelE/ParE family toxin [Steroidobacteraceae bacterium]